MRGRHRYLLRVRTAVSGLLDLFGVFFLVLRVFFLARMYYSIPRAFYRNKKNKLNLLIL